MSPPPQTPALGDFKPSDQWQTHVNAIFYGIQGPGIHNHFQTYVSRDHRLAHTLAEIYFEETRSRAQPAQTRFIQEWGVGNGNLAACFLTRLREIDSEGIVYPHTHYLLCDYSNEILKGARTNPRLKPHEGRFSTIRVDAERLDCFRPHSVDKILSNEIWDDLATKVLLKHQNLLYEEYIQPHLDPAVLPDGDFETFRRLFNEKNLPELRDYPPFLPQITWERTYQRVEVGDWPFAAAIEAQLDQIADEIPVPINLGAFATLERAHHLLRPDSQGFTTMDYGMFSMEDLNHEGRPYFNLYGGQYTFMVNFDLLGRVGKAAGFHSVEKEYQHRFVGRRLNENVLSVVELLQSHPGISHMAPWDRDLLMLQTLQALNATYRSPYRYKMDYPPVEGTPKKPRKQILQMAKNLSASGVPDTVAYVTESEVLGVMKQLRRLGYIEKDLRQTFQHPFQPISFVCMNFR